MMAMGMTSIRLSQETSDLESGPDGQDQIVEVEDESKTNDVGKDDILASCDEGWKIVSLYLIY